SETHFNERLVPPVVPRVPAEGAVKIHQALPVDILKNWVVKQAEWEAETAGPTEEERKRQFRDLVRQGRSVPGALPETYDLAERVVQAVYAAARAKEKQVLLKLGYARIWTELTDLSGLATCLSQIVKAVRPVLGPDAGGVEVVQFLYCAAVYKGGRWEIEKR